MRTIYLVLKEDIIFYPPVLSIINILLELGYKVVHIGVYSDDKQKKYLESKGVVFVPTVKYDGKGSLIKKLYQQLLFKNQVISYLKKSVIKEMDYLWIFQAETVCLLDSIIPLYNTIIQQFEFDEPSLNWKYKLLNPSFSMGKALKNAKKVISCEYNRAQITKGIFQLNKLPVVLPNKPHNSNIEINEIPEDIQSFVDKVKTIVEEKVAIIYQGVFLPERSLDDFCKAIEEMPDNYILLMMGKQSELYNTLRQKYESDRIVFLPFIKPPYHLLITQLAKIGILSYIPNPQSISGVINPLYCAPNKIFEYAKYGIPMISNDIPGLHYTFLEYKCGISINELTVSNIQNTIKIIVDNYKFYSENSIKFYNSIDTKYIIANSIVN